MNTIVHTQNPTVQCLHESTLLSYASWWGEVRRITVGDDWIENGFAETIRAGIREADKGQLQSWDDVKASLGL